MSADKPFLLRGGQDRQAAEHNRIRAIERIKFLSGVDLRERSVIYMQALDLEMWQRWYKGEPPTKPIDEEFCQRAAQVIMGMEGKDVTLDKDAYDKAQLEHAQNLEAAHDSEHAQSGNGDAGKTEQNAS